MSVKSKKMGRVKFVLVFFILPILMSVIGYLVLANTYSIEGADNIIALMKPYFFCARLLVYLVTFTFWKELCLNIIKPFLIKKQGQNEGNENIEILVGILLKRRWVYAFYILIFELLIIQRIIF